MRFSKLTQCFYPSDIAYVTLPVDIVDVTQNDFNLAMSRSPGETIDFVNGSIVIVPAPKITLAQSQVTQITALVSAYLSAIAMPVTFKTAAGVSKSFQADAQSVANVQATLAGLQAVAATPAGFYWVAADNTQVPFTYADVQGLAAAMLAQGWVAFQHLQTKKADVRNAGNIADVEAVIW